MRTPYTALRQVRQVLERDAELAIARAHQTVATLNGGLATLGSLRERWIEWAVGDARPESEHAHLQIAALDATEAALRASLLRAEAVLEEARTNWMARYRERRVAEDLETRVLEEQRGVVERREQTAVDDLAVILRRRAMGGPE
jgi:flagellar export protein FliJ